MRILLIVLPLIVGVVYADEISTTKNSKLLQKGKKIVDTLCDSDKLPISTDIDIAIEKLKKSKACPPLSASKLKAVTYYITSRNTQTPPITHRAAIVVPKDAKCPVCGMLVHKYPKWTTKMIVDGKSYYFDGVKDMMKYYIYSADFPYDRKSISKILVNDYYTLEAIDAKDAYYVYDSDLFGPMGRELIAFRDERSAKSFSDDHNGKSILRFDEISSDMIVKLDSE